MAKRSPGPRKERITNEERLFDLLPAAWNMDDATFETIAGFTKDWMWEWRNHYLSPSREQLHRLRRLARFHHAIRLTYARSPNYGEWWRHRWREDSFIGYWSPLEAALAEGDEFFDKAERYFWAPR